MLTANINLSLLATLTTAPDIGSATYALNEALALAALADGNGLNQANRVWSDRRTLNAATAENINMYTPFTVDALGQNLTLSKCKALYIKNRGGAVLSASDILKYGGEGSAAAWNSIFDGSDTAKGTIEPNGAILWVAPSAAGYAIANTTNHLLKVENMNGSQAIDYDIIIIGSQ